MQFDGMGWVEIACHVMAQHQLGCDAAVGWKGGKGMELQLQ